MPEGFTIEQVAGPDLLSYPMFATFDAEGRLFVFESTGPNTMSTEDMLEDPPYHIRLVEDLDGDGVFDRSRIFADRIPLPMGGTFHQGSLYVAAPPDLMRLTDRDGDGRADERETILSGWVLNHNAAVLSGPFFGPDGWLYLADARRGFEIATREGEVLKGKGARIWRCRPDGRGLEWVSGGGFDNAVELAFLPSGETIGTMTYFVDPQHGQRDALMHWVEGGVYPKPHPVIGADALKRTGELMPVMTKLPRVAPSGLMRYRGPSFGPAFEGNLFSAQFNTGRVLRHVVSRHGATYRTDDEPFLTSNSPDAHPTDVLQDADGSLLVLDTGGWFIEGCPLSRVAKPDVPGGIYRVRKLGAPAVEDPRGRRLGLDAKRPHQLVAYLEDPRPVVRDRAVERLVQAGGAAVPPLTEALHRSEDEDVRAAVVFALYRIETPEALEAVRSALRDESATVRTAAARALGLSRDTMAVDRLMEIVREDRAPVRRQAATALGQIGERRVVPALLAAAADPEDRFVEHAITYALITLAEPAPLLDALHHTSSGVRKAALIALDQMDGSPLRRQQVLPFLASGDPELRQAGVWVASHHQDWSDIVLGFLDARLAAADLPEAETAAVEEVLSAFCEDESVQALMARRLGEAGTPGDRKLLLLDVMDGCGVEELPPSWKAQVRQQLKGGDPQLRSRALALVASRGLTGFLDDLERIAGDPAVPAGFRLEALGARVSIQPGLREAPFRFLLDHLHPEMDAAFRQRAARILAQGEPSDAQLLTLAREYVARADVFILPRLVEAFRGSRSGEVGEALVSALLTSTDRLANLSGQEVDDLLSNFPDSIQTAAIPLVEALHERQAARLEHLQELERRLSGGDVGAGRKLFFGKALCSVCHAVGAEGGQFGPDLTNIGEIRSRHDMLEALLYPSASFAREYDTFRITTASNAYTGVLTEQTQQAVIVRTGPSASVRIPRGEIISIEPQTVSMMPPGLDQQLTEAELADLLAFLEALPYRLDRLIERNGQK